MVDTAIYSAQPSEANEEFGGIDADNLGPFASAGRSLGEPRERGGALGHLAKRGMEGAMGHVSGNIHALLAADGPKLSGRVIPR